MTTFKKVLAWSGIILGVVVLILLVINAYLVWRTDSQLRAEYAAIRAQGHPVVLSDLAREVPAEANAVTYLRQTQEELAVVERELQQAVGSKERTYRDLTAEELSRLPAPLAAHPRVLPLLEQAAGCPDYLFPMDLTVQGSGLLPTKLDQLQEMRRVVRVLQAEGIWLLSRGRREEALNRGLLMLRLSRRPDERPSMMVGGLVAVACRVTTFDLIQRVLQSGEVPADARQRLEAELAVQGVLAAGQRSLVAERSFGVWYLQQMPGRKVWLARAYWNGQELAYLTAMQRLIESMGAGEQPQAAFDQAYRQAERDTARSPLARLMLPAVKTYQEACLRTEAQLRCLRVFNALQGRSPEDAQRGTSAADLGLPEEATLDPFSGKPLIIKRLPEGWLVYSIGQNLRDDGGQLSEDGQADLGVGPQPSAPR